MSLAGLFGLLVMLERQEVQESGEPSCRSARNPVWGTGNPRNLSPHFAAEGGKTSDDLNTLLRVCASATIVDVPCGIEPLFLRHPEESNPPTAASSRQWNTARTDASSRLHLAEEPGTSDAPGRASDRNRGRRAPSWLLWLQPMLRDDDHS